jgi:hypothetical protein
MAESPKSEENTADEYALASKLLDDETTEEDVSSNRSVLSHVIELVRPTHTGLVKVRGGTNRNRGQMD